MKKIKIHLILIAVLMILTACGQEEDIPDPIISEPDATSPAVTPSSPLAPDSASPDIISPDIISEDDSQPPREGMVRSRLTNEWVDPDVADTRPIAVMIPNECGAIPH